MLTIEEVGDATRRSAVALALDDRVRHYSPETIALVHKQTVLALWGAKDLLRAASRIAADPELDDVPDVAVEQIMAASFEHFARALSPRSNPGSDEVGG